jgi:hypothetical protein
LNIILLKEASLLRIKRIIKSKVASLFKVKIEVVHKYIKMLLDDSHYNVIEHCPIK